MSSAAEVAAQLIHGSCLCGAVHYEVANGFGSTVICYCNNCRKATGSTFMANSFINKSNLKITHGSSNLRTYSDSTCDSGATLDRTFCSSCGSPLFTYNKGKFPMGVIVSVGTMNGVAVGSVGDRGEEDAVVWKPSMELFCKNKPRWLNIEGMEEKKEMVGFYSEEGGLARP